MVANAPRFGTEKALEPLRRVHRAGTHLLGLINQVLDLSKIEAGKLELSPEQVNLAPLIDDVIGTARQLAEQKSNRLSVDYPRDLGSLLVDPMPDWHRSLRVIALLVTRAPGTGSHCATDAAGLCEALRQAAEE